MKYYPTICCVIAVLLSSVGCSSLKSNMKSLNPLAPFPDKQDSQSDAQPASMAVIWSDSVYEKPGVASVKGFGGRIFIYDSGNNSIKAEGELIVYGYDESNPTHGDGNHSGADKKFVFPSEKFQDHFSGSDLGPSYSVWIPWEKTGSVRKSITLIPVFKTANGGVLRCGQSINVLPGRKPDVDNAQAAATDPIMSPNVIAQASFQNPAAKHDQHSRVNHASSASDINSIKPRLRTTTLNLPPSLGKKLAAKSSPRKPDPQTNFPRPNQSTHRTDSRHEGSGSSAESGTEPPSPTAPKPRIFGVPGTF